MTDLTNEQLRELLAKAMETSPDGDDDSAIKNEWLGRVFEADEELKDHLYDWLPRLLDENEALKAKLGRYKWQSMETAPMGVCILTEMKYGCIEGRWDGETCNGYYWTDLEWYPSAWMPIPEGNE